MKYTIYPYRLIVGEVTIAGKVFSDLGRVWVFDDKNTNLIQEGLISGMETVIETALSEFNIKNGVNGFRLDFSNEPFLGSNIEAIFLGKGGCRNIPDYEGSWYNWNVNGIEIEGWLCPALFLYFDTVPTKIYAKISSKETI